LLLLFLLLFIIKDGQVPKEWKEANVAAVYKQESRQNPANYRPVSLTSQVGKVFEKIIKKELVAYLEGNELIRETQHGFRKNRSCLTNLLHFFEAVAEEVDRGEPVDVLYFDFRKAFDRVSHERLLLKLKAIGVEGRLLCWIKDWLKERRQRVVLGGGATQQEAFITDVKNKATNSFQVLHDASSPNVLFEFDAACISYVVNPSVDGRDTITFTVKISGDINLS
jgi:hypothetical protein